MLKERKLILQKAEPVNSRDEMVAVRHGRLGNGGHGVSSCQSTVQRQRRSATLPLHWDR